MRRSKLLGDLLGQPTNAQWRDFFRRRRRTDLTFNELLEPNCLLRILHSYGRRHGPSAPLAAVAGEWSKRYFARVMKPIATAAMLLDWRMPLTPADLSIDVSAEGEIVSLGLSDFGRPVLATSAEDRFAFLISGNIEGVIRAVSEVSGLSRNVLWSNAGNVFEGIARSYAMDNDCSVAGVADALDLLDARNMADGSRNPLFKPIIYPHGEGKPKRLRRVCCIRYLIDGLDYCKTCPCPARHSPPRI
ncbi:siderophore-iron reductase FhuF [Agrobacterium sp. NPDC058088]|uniref:siderophore-iron reductase FhuF n=1 Tax=Agrobacterium sp. NPDC058088 TaxID=3346335 RepID=UPI0036DE8807